MKHNIKLITGRSMPYWPNKCSFDELLEEQRKHSLVELDLETTGLNAFRNRPIAVQIGLGDTAYVIDTTEFDLSKLKFLEQKFCLGHNIKFDLLFLMVHGGIFINKVYDTYIAELLLTNGKKVKRSLGAVVKRYCGEDIDKGQQSRIHITGLNSKEAVMYSGNDVLYLKKVAEKQTGKIRSEGLTQVCKDEMSTIPAFAYMEYSGFCIDQNKWKATYKVSAENSQGCKRKLDEYAVAGCPSLKKTQYHLFHDFPETYINWNAPLQAKGAFIKLGLMDEEGSMGKDELKKIDSEVVREYINFKESRKMEGTYGEAFLRHVEDDGRIHTTIKQIVKTGRTASSPNLQNIPKRKEFRSCFIPNEGNKLIICDYSGQESVILADVSQEPKLLEFYQSGGADLHSFVAQLIWYEELKDLELSEIAELHKDKRQKAKAANFAIAYGGNGATIANNINIPIAEGKRVYKGFMAAFGGLGLYFDDKFKETIENGYVLINDISGRKMYFDFWDRFMHLYNIVKSGQFWGEFYQEKRKQSNYYLRELLPMRERYSNWEHIVKKASMNAPIQGTAADQKKMAMRNFYKWIAKEGLIGVVRTPIEVHDEIVAECPTHMVDKVAPKLQEAMEQAGNHYLQTLKIKAQPVIKECWWEGK